MPKWSTCCWEDNPDAQGGLELSDLNSYSFPLKESSRGSLRPTERLRSSGSHDGTQSPPGAQAPCLPLVLASLKGIQGPGSIDPGPWESHFKAMEGKAIE